MLSNKANLFIKVIDALEYGTSEDKITTSSIVYAISALLLTNKPINIKEITIFTKICPYVVQTVLGEFERIGIIAINNGNIKIKWRKVYEISNE